MTLFNEGNIINVLKSLKSLKSFRAPKCFVGKQITFTFTLCDKLLSAMHRVLCNLFPSAVL